jgi:hypothetical protein
MREPHKPPGLPDFHGSSERAVFLPIIYTYQDSEKSMVNHYKDAVIQNPDGEGGYLRNAGGATNVVDSRCLKSSRPFRSLVRQGGICVGWLCALFAFSSRICSAEDLNYIKLDNPVRYEKKYIDADNNVITNFMDVEEVSGRIKFHLMTVTHGSVCELSGEAFLRQQEPKRRIQNYQFDQEKCHLSIQKDDGKGTVLALDPGGVCSGYVCGQSGVINGYEFSLKK